jgi:hypothetical protein
MPEIPDSPVLDSRIDPACRFCLRMTIVPRGSAGPLRRGRQSPAFSRAVLGQTNTGAIDVADEVRTGVMLTMQPEALSSIRVSLS